jgi:hypothetical protein
VFKAVRVTEVIGQAGGGSMAAKDLKELRPVHLEKRLIGRLAARVINQGVALVEKHFGMAHQRLYSAARALAPAHCEKAIPKIISRDGNYF